MNCARHWVSEATPFPCQRRRQCVMDSHNCDKSSEEDSPPYGSTWSLNSSTYDSTYEGSSSSWPDAQPVAPFTPTPSSTRRTSVVDSLLAEIYSRKTTHLPPRVHVSEGDVDLTDCHPESSSVIGEGVWSASGRSDRCYLEQLNVVELRSLSETWRSRVDIASTRLLGILKQREKLKGQIEKNCRVVSAVLRSWAAKRNPESAGKVQDKHMSATFRLIWHPQMIIPLTLPTSGRILPCTVGVWYLYHQYTSMHSLACPPVCTRAH